MTALKALPAVLLALFLLSLVRVGGGGEYSAQGFRAWVKAGPFSIRVFPLREKKSQKLPGEKKVQKAEPSREDSPKKGGALERVRRYLPLVCEAAGELKRRVRVDQLRIDYTLAGAEDAAAAAMAFGYSNAAAGIILPLFEQNFEVKSSRVRTAVDFNAREPAIYLRAALSVRVGQLAGFALRFGRKFWKLYRKPQLAKKEAI